MQLISPDVLNAANGLSAGASGFILFVGILMWMFGWRWHKFWVVFGITTAAGILGLNAGQAAGGQVMAIGVLLAFAGGVMAMEVARLLAFAVGGMAAWLAVQLVLPAAQEMWAVFLAGGLFGVILYRLWTMLLTSLLGVLLSWHAAFAMAGPLGRFDAVNWVAEHSAALNGGVIIVTLLGVIVQTIAASERPEEKKKEVKPEKPAEVKKESWWEPIRKAA